MEELIKILNLNNYDIEQYVDSKIMKMDSLSSDIKEVYLEDGEIYEGWISTDVSYWPSGNRSKGFKLTKQFYIDFCNYIKQSLGNVDVNAMKAKFNSEKLMKIINLYLSIYFGETCNDDLRKEIFSYGNLDSIGETLNIETLKGKNVARCIEKSSGFNGLANFMGINCSLVVSEATVKNNTTGHAYCLLKENEKYKICDPNFFDADSDGKRVPFIFDLDTNNKENEIIFNSSKYGSINPTIIKYDFPWSKLNKEHNIIEKDYR